MKKILTGILMIVMMVGLTACGDQNQEQPEEQIDYEIAMVTDSGLLMDGGYSEVAWTAISEFGASEGVSHKYYKAAEATEEAYRATIDNAIDKGAKVIIADGYDFETVVYQAQSDYPDVKFVLIDAEPMDADSGETKIGKNTATISFSSQQSGYLAGYAAVEEGYRQLGFMADNKEPELTDYGYGFLQGAEAASRQNGVQVNVNYHYGSNEDDRSQISQMASDWYGQGTEVIFACGSQCEQPVIEAAELLEKKVIAFETEKSQMSDTIITSAGKDIGGALETILQQYKDDEFPGGEVISYDASNDGIWMEMENGRFAVFAESQYEDLLERLASGDTQVLDHNAGDLSQLGLSNVTVSEQ